MTIDQNRGKETLGAEIGRLITNLLPDHDPNKPSVRDILILTEEKRRLLTCIIEYTTMGVTRLGLRIYDLLELHKRVNSAATMEDLAKISEELVKFREAHPELET